MRIQLLVASVATLAMALAASPVGAQKKSGPGYSETEIRIGNTMAYSGPVSAFTVSGKAMAAYFNMLNEKEGGINGRKINFISLDDGYSPPKTVEQTRRLVERDDVLLVFGSAGTPTSTAVHKYLNSKKVPQLFIGSGATKWGDPENFPWSMGWAVPYQAEAKIYAKYILDNIKDPKIGILYQNDDFGKDYLAGIREGLGEKASKLIVKEESYETADPTVDSQIINLKSSGANVFINVSTPKFAALAIRKAHSIDWKPTQFLGFTAASIGAVLTPAGLDASTGVITIQFLKDYSDPAWGSDPGMQSFVAFMKQYYPDGDPNNFFITYAFSQAQTLAAVLRQAGDDPSRENVMKAAASIKDLELPLLLPDIKINTGPNDFYPIEQARLVRFNGTSWEPISGVLNP